MRVCVLAAALLFVSCSVVPAGRQEGAPAPRNEVALLLGQRYFQDDDLDDADLDEQFGYALEYHGEVEGWPVGYEVGFARSEGDGELDVGGGVGEVDTESDLMEIYVGARKTFTLSNPKLRPYVGGGLSYADAEVEFSAQGQSLDDDDTTVALYVHGGLAWDVAKNFSIGADLRFLLGADMDFFDDSTDVDYTQIALVLGYSF